MAQPPLLVSDLQRDRAVAHLQTQYAQGVIGEEELDRRLDLALEARNRLQLDAALHGLPRIAPLVVTRPAPGAATPAENVGAGLIHLSSFFGWFLGPAIMKAIATPGSRTWWEAGRALSLQLGLGAVGLAAVTLAIVLGAGEVVLLAWLLWAGATVVATVRAFNGQSSTGRLEAILPLRPVAPRRLA